MVVVATGAAYAVLETNITIIPLALGVLGYGYGSLLGIFLLGVLSTRGQHVPSTVLFEVLRRKPTTRARHGTCHIQFLLSFLTQHSPSPATPAS
jgi:hypothetical protein